MVRTRETTRIIQASTKAGDWILDPFNGSGTTGIAANLLYRKYLGLEINPEYLEMSKARRAEIEDPNYSNYYRVRLVSAKAIPKLDQKHLLMEEENVDNYGIPW